LIPRTSYLLFIDESGTHDMVNVDPAFPVFVLVGLLVGERYYQQTLVPRVKALKRKYFGQDDIILHSSDIRRGRGGFAALRSNQERSNQFNADIGALFTRSRIRLYAVVIHKPSLRSKFLLPLNPYDASLSQLLSVVCGPPRQPGPNRPVISRISAESRGRREDKELQREFQQFRVSGLSNYGAADVQHRKAITVQRAFPQRVDFVRKSLAIAGLELTDLAAYPIARGSISEAWTRADAAVIAAKLRALVRFP
jgi:hypothetical protein